MTKKVLNKNQKISSMMKEPQFKTFSFVEGCNYDCKYCAAKSMAIRYKRKEQGTWRYETVIEKKILQKVKKYDGKVIFPSTHDINYDTADISLMFLDKILNAGNEVIVTLKPHSYVICKICENFLDFRNQILFRFSIGSLSNSVLKFWEPHAPSFSDRFSALDYSYRMGYQTSVTIEPALDDKTFELVQKVAPYVTDTIWIGLAKGLKSNLVINGHGDPETLKRAEDLKKMQTENWVRELAEKLADNPQIRWKDSCMKILKVDRPIVGSLDFGRKIAHLRGTLC